MLGCAVSLVKSSERSTTDAAGAAASATASTSTTN